MLKKTAISLAAVALLAGAAFAMNNPDYIENVPGVNFKPSNNVKVTYKFDATAATAPQNYLVAAKNTAGDTIYATSNISTTIYKKKPTVSATAGPGIALSLTDANVSTLSAAGESLFDGWDPM